MAVEFRFAECIRTDEQLGGVVLEIARKKSTQQAARSDEATLVVLAEKGRGARTLLDGKKFVLAAARFNRQLQSDAPDLDLAVRKSYGFRERQRILLKGHRQSSQAAQAQIESPNQFARVTPEAQIWQSPQEC